MGQGFVVVVLVGRYVASGLLCPRGLSGVCLRRALRQLWSSFSSSSCRRLSLTAPLALYLVTRWLTLASSWEVELDFVAYASFVEFAYVVLFVHSGLLRLRSPAGSLATVVFSRFEPLAGEGLWQALLLLHLVARSPVLVALYGGCDGADRLRPLRLLGVGLRAALCASLSSASSSSTSPDTLQVFFFVRVVSGAAVVWLAAVRVSRTLGLTTAGSTFSACLWHLWCRQSLFNVG